MTMYQKFMGAATALHAALELGDRVRTLVLVIPPTGWETRAGQVDLVVRFIAEENLELGDRLPSIRELAEQFGLKSVAVRDALLDAQGKGLVKVLSRSSTFVAQTTQ